MVNVGGRSKGCSTCRRRRVKCDENRPVCMRCQRWGFECEGPKDITFIEGKIVESRRTNKQATVSTNDDITDTHSEHLQISPSISLKGIELEIYVCHARKNLRRGGPIDIALQEIQPSDITTAGMMAANGQMFQRAMLSFAIVVFGAKHGQSNITDQGYALHGVALKQLNQALSEPNCYTRDEVILSVATLAILECAVPTGPKYYLKHMIGLERLLELRNPSSYCSPKSCELYKSVRHMILFASLRTGRPSILARAEWKKVLRANCSDEEMQEQDLFDVLADCTVLITERDMMLLNWELDPEKILHQRDRIKRSALTLLTDLRGWRRRWDSDGRNSYSETSVASSGLEPAHEARKDDPPSFLTIFEFSNDFAATMLMFYNTTLIYVLQILASLPPDNPDALSDQNFTQLISEDAEHLDDLWKYTKNDYIAAERLAALEVCRCIPYYLARKSRFDSDTSPVAHWAVTTAWLTLRGNESADGRWVMDLQNMKIQEVVAKGLWAG